MQSLELEMKRNGYTTYDQKNLKVIDLTDGLKVGEMKEVPLCPICLEDIKARAVVMPCGHMFDETCAKQWLETKPSCPICRQRI